MPEKPSRAAEYSKEQVQLVTATCLYVATILGDYMEQAVIVGSLVLSILIDQKNKLRRKSFYISCTNIRT